MDEAAFEAVVADEWTRIPEHFKTRVQNLAVLVADEPDEQMRKEHHLGPQETLLGLYHGVPNTARGDVYGIGATLPDTVTLFRMPIVEEAERVFASRGNPPGGFVDAVRTVVRDTLWHEVGHYFGLDDAALHTREDAQTNRYQQN